MAAIDIGNAAIDRASGQAALYTWVDKINPANADGKITLVEIYAYEAMVNCEVAIFQLVAADTFTTRSNVTLGSVPLGYSSYTVDLSVKAGDYIGIYFTAGGIDRDTVAGLAGYWYKQLDAIPCTNLGGFTLQPDRILSLFGSGATPAGKSRGVIIG